MITTFFYELLSLVGTLSLELLPIPFRVPPHLAKSNPKRNFRLTEPGSLLLKETQRVWGETEVLISYAIYIK